MDTTTAAASNRVAVVPFRINAEKDLTFIRDGIVDMLTSRLSWDEKVIVINREETAKASGEIAQPLTETKAREIGRGLAADYVLFGSLTVFGNSVSIDAKMIDVSGNKPPLSLSNQGQGMDEVIPAINQFATDINEQIFGRVIASRKDVVQSQTTQEQPDLRTHPEKLFTGGFGAVDEAETQSAAPGSAFIATQDARSQASNFWKSQTIKENITGIAIGDADKDGKMETVIITPHSVEIFRLEKQRFHKVNTALERRLDNFIGVDIADINGNGYPEIFVSALNPLRNMISSFVLEFNGQTYVEIVKDSRWYYRAIEHPIRGRILLGQKHVTADPFSGQIFEMIWNNAAYEPANPVMRSSRANVMGFALGNAMNDAQEVAVAFDKLDHLRIFDQTGNDIWKDGEISGGTPEYFVLPLEGSGGSRDMIYFPMRIVICDINRDAKNEVITIKNKRLSELISYRKFTEGEIEIRSWDGIGLTALWRTRKLSGFLSDFVIGDFDNDGKDELIVALVIQTGTVVATDPKSRIIAYELE